MLILLLKPEKKIYKVMDSSTSTSITIRIKTQNICFSQWLLLPPGFA